MIAGEKKEEEEEKKHEEEKEKKKHEEEETRVPIPIPIEKSEEEAVVQPEEKKGFLEKIKDILPGHHKRAEEVEVVVAPPPPGHHKKAEEVEVAPPPPPPTVVECYAAPAEQDSPKEKKGFLEKIKEKIHGNHHKTTGEEDKEKEKD